MRGPFGAWRLVTATLVLVGVVGSVLGATLLARSDARSAHHRFMQASGQIASTLQLAIQHEQDLIVSAGAFIADDPNASEGQFVRWANSVHALARYPELIGLGHTVVVPAAKLPAFEAHALIHPAGPLSARGTFQIVPPGKRPFYCLSVASVSKTPQDAVPAGFDYCAGLASLLKSARDSGLGAYLPEKEGTTSLLSILTPLYRNGTVPRTTAARRHEFLGFVGMGVITQVVLGRALQDHPGVAAIFRYRLGSSDASFRSGRVPAAGQSTTVNFHNGWTVETFEAGANTGVFANGNSLMVLIGGLSLSLVLGALVLVLATGRARALRLVDEKTAQLSFDAMHDGLTKLPNRALVRDRAEQLLARGRRLNTPIAALFIDVDDFKHVNDTFGHAAGDEFLRMIAARLISVIRDGDTAGRLGGDEFVVLVEGTTLLAGPDAVAERLLSALRQPFKLEGFPGRPQFAAVSIGIAGGQRANADELLRDADLALYRAKELGKNRYVVFEQGMQAEAAQRLELDNDLGAALTNQEFFLLYQPTFDLQSQAVTGVEALIRWRHPSRGVVAPDLFIPLAERNAMIIPIGRWVLRQACDQAAAWHAAGQRIGMSVNVSARQLERDEFVDEVRSALADSGLEPLALTLEIAETVLMQNVDAAASRLSMLKALGVRIAIDDFGTSYSSLTYLRQFPVDMLKIDRSFISEISSSPEAAVLMHMLVGLGKALGLETLAEGIEEHAQLAQLKLEQCDAGQGFMYARPLDPEAVSSFLEQRHVTS